MYDIYMEHVMCPTACRDGGARSVLLGVPREQGPHAGEEGGHGSAWPQTIIIIMIIIIMITMLLLLLLLLLQNKSYDYYY